MRAQVLWLHPAPPMRATRFVRDHRHRRLLQHVRLIAIGRRLAPAQQVNVAPGVLIITVWQANWTDARVEFDFKPGAYKGHIVAAGTAKIGMDDELVDVV